MTNQLPNQEHENTAEVPLQDNPYGESVRRLIADASHFNPNQLSQMIGNGLVKDIVESAEAGKFFSQRKNEQTGEIMTIIYSVEDILNGQIEGALLAQDKEPDNPRAWAVNIPRADGLRDAVMTVLKHKRLSEPFRMAIYREQAELMKQRDEAASSFEIPELTAEQVALRQKAEEDLGEEAVEASGVGLEANAAARVLGMDQKEQEPTDPYAYLRKALPPVVRPQKVSKKVDYDKLLSGADDEQPWAQQQQRGFGQYEPETEEDKQRKYYDMFVTQENREKSLETLSETVKATPELREILERFAIAPTSLDAVDAIRENPDVRFEVAKVLAKKLDRLALDPNNDMGWRINDNSPNNLKVDPMTAKRMLSRTYAVSMALKMIDGEFSEKRADKDAIERDDEGRVALGQHRHAATTTLMAYY